jgi:hypothetical protein
MPQSSPHKSSELNNAQIALAEFLKDFAKSTKAKNTAIIQYDLHVPASFRDGFRPDLRKILKFKYVFDLAPARGHLSHQQLENVEFDFSFCVIPFAMPRQPFILNEKIEVSQEINLLLKALQSLSTDGILFTLVSPSMFSSNNSPGSKAVKLLSDNGFYCNFLLKGLNGRKRDEKIFPHTALDPLLAGFQKIKTKKRFVAHIDSFLEDHKNELISNFNDIKGNHISRGLWIENALLPDIRQQVYSDRIKSLGSQYSSYDHLSIKELSDQVNHSKTDLKEIPNSVYIPKLGNSLITSDKTSLSIKEQNVIQVVLKKELVFAEYIELFFLSTYGVELRESLLNGNAIKFISKTSLLAAEIPIPSIEQQKILIEAKNKINKLEGLVMDFKSELSLRPDYAAKFLEQYDKVHKSLTELTAEEKILEMIKTGETTKVEFKETFETDVQHGGKVPKNTLRESAMKEIVAFVNQDGGTLLIGVADDGNITGIEKDNFKSEDKYLLNFKDVFKTKIGSEWSHRIEFALHTVRGKLVLRVDCQPGIAPCYMNRIPYIRLGPSAEELDQKSFLDFSKKRWP